MSNVVAYLILGTETFIDEARARCSRSVASGVAVHDTRFVELAARTGRSLLTFDRAVTRAFPEHRGPPA